MNAQKVRDGLDKIDETPFGKLDKLFNQLADDAQRAVNDHAALAAAARKALNYIENTESELGIKLPCGDALREAMADASK